MPLHPCTDACRYEEMEAVIDRLRDGDTCARQCEGTAYRIEARRLRSSLQRLTTAVGDLAVEKADDELHRAFAEAKALLTPNVKLRGAEQASLAERPSPTPGSAYSGD